MRDSLRRGVRGREHEERSGVDADEEEVLHPARLWNAAHPRRDRHFDRVQHEPCQGHRSDIEDDGDDDPSGRVGDSNPGAAKDGGDEGPAAVPDDRRWEGMQVALVKVAEDGHDRHGAVIDQPAIGDAPLGVLRATRPRWHRPRGARSRRCPPSQDREFARDHRPEPRKSFREEVRSPPCCEVGAEFSVREHKKRTAALFEREAGAGRLGSRDSDYPLQRGQPGIPGMHIDHHQLQS